MISNQACRVEFFLEALGFIRLE